MHDDKRFDELLYHYVILLATLKIKDHYFEAVTKEIYENSGQLLSLVRVELAILGNQLQTDQKNLAAKPGDLVGNVIGNLREMSKSFFPEKEISSGNG